MRKGICIVLLFLFISSSLRIEAAILGTSSPTQAETTKKFAIKERALQIGVGKTMEVRLKNKEKLLGRMGAISNEAFVLHIAKGKQIEARTISFDEVESLKKAGWSTAKKIAVIAEFVVIGLGVIVVGAVLGATE